MNAITLDSIVGELVTDRTSTASTSGETHISRESYSYSFTVSGSTETNGNAQGGFEAGESRVITGLDEEDNETTSTETHSSSGANSRDAGGNAWIYNATVEIDGESTLFSSAGSNPQALFPPPIGYLTTYLTYYADGQFVTGGNSSYSRVSTINGQSVSFPANQSSASGLTQWTAEETVTPWTSGGTVDLFTAGGSNYRESAASGPFTVELYGRTLVCDWYDVGPPIEILTPSRGSGRGRYWGDEWNRQISLAIDESAWIGTTVLPVEDASALATTSSSWATPVKKGITVNVIAQTASPVAASALAIGSSRTNALTNTTLNSDHLLTTTTVEGIYVYRAEPLTTSAVSSVFSTKVVPLEISSVDSASRQHNGYEGYINSSTYSVVTGYGSYTYPEIFRIGGNASAPPSTTTVAQVGISEQTAQTHSYFDLPVLIVSNFEASEELVDESGTTVTGITVAQGAGVTKLHTIDNPSNVWVNAGSPGGTYLASTLAPGILPFVEQSLNTANPPAVVFSSFHIRTPDVWNQGAWKSEFDLPELYRVADGLSSFIWPEFNRRTTVDSTVFSRSAHGRFPRWATPNDSVTGTTTSTAQIYLVTLSTWSMESTGQVRMKSTVELTIELHGPIAGTRIAGGSNFHPALHPDMMESGPVSFYGNREGAVVLLDGPAYYEAYADSSAVFNLIDRDHPKELDVASAQHAFHGDSAIQFSTANTVQYDIERKDRYGIREADVVELEPVF